MKSEVRLVNAAVLLTDFHGFTKYAADLAPVDTFHFLNNYYKTVGDIVYKNNGQIIKYMGDSILSFYSNDHSSQPCDDALNTAIQLLATGNIKTNCSIHYGQIALGTIGHPNLQNIDIIGHSLNLLFRQLSADKEFNLSPPYIIISGDTYDQLRQKQLVKLLGEVIYKGIENPIKIFSYKNS